MSDQPIQFDFGAPSFESIPPRVPGRVRLGCMHVHPASRVGLSAGARIRVFARILTGGRVVFRCGLCPQQGRLL